MISAFVFDTNALISAYLLPNSVSRKAFDKATRLGILVYSTDTMHEFSTVFMRPKFDRYQTVESRLAIITSFEQRNQLITVTHTVSESRDSADNMFLALALSAPTKAIISGDPDLLTLHPFRGIPILNASDFLNSF
jgi:uncharacterized protein